MREFVVDLGSLVYKNLSYNWYLRKKVFSQKKNTDKKLYIYISFIYLFLANFFMPFNSILFMLNRYYIFLEYSKK